ncbi:MAG TPA: tyrosine-type recombinase/integrase, partial [Limnobacter sp.]|uniref:tyrosine-type recombinase/integrase n=1 Tax=Limnobacter sp. TaxID=2003368 RepID=UPI002E3395ED
ALELIGQPEGKVFNTTPTRLDANWRKLCEAAGVENLTFHDARHMAATWLSKKLDPLALAKMLGHRDLKHLLNTYYKEDAASLVEKLD